MLRLLSTLAVTATLAAGCAPSAPSTPLAPSAPSAQPPAAAKEAAAPLSTGNTDMPAPASGAEPPRSSFRLGCTTEPPDPLPDRITLARVDAGEHWIWACRALAKLGKPKIHESGYPTFNVRDLQTGACIALALEEVGAFLYYAPKGRGEALRDELLTLAKPPDCSFLIDRDHGVIGPRRVGLKDGKPFDEPIFDLTTFAGVRAWFEAHPSDASAAALVSSYRDLPPAERPADAPTLIDRAVAIQMDKFDEMKPAWLSDIGLQGYCEVSKKFTQLPLSNEVRSRVNGQIKRFCK